MVALDRALFDRLRKDRVGFIRKLAKHLKVTPEAVKHMRVRGYGMTAKGQRRIKAVNAWMGRVR